MSEQPPTTDEPELFDGEPPESFEIQMESEPPAPARLDVATAPSRAFRRRRPGVPLGVLAAVVAFVAGAVPAMALLAWPTPEAPVPQDLPSVAVPSPVALDVAAQRLRQLGAEVTAAREKELEAAREQLLEGLARDLPALMQQIRVARDERLETKSGALGGPFTAAELSAAFGRLGLAEGRGRYLLDREGNVVAPEGADLDVKVGLAAPGRGEGILAEVTGAGRERTVVARRCLAKEKHCLVEVAAFDVPPADIDDALAAIDAATEMQLAASTQLAAVASSISAAAPSPSSEGPPPWALALLSALLAAAAGVLVAWRARRGNEAFEDFVVGAATSHQMDRGAVPTELASAADAVAVLADRAHRSDALDDELRQIRARLGARVDELEAVLAGQATALTPEGEVREVALVELVNRLVESVERRVTRLQSHLAVLSPEDASRSDDDGPPLERRVDALRPVGTLLSDIALRLRAVAKTLPETAPSAGDLLRLAEAVSARSKTATALLDGLAEDIKSLPPPSASGLDGRQLEALESLTRDLSAISKPPQLAQTLLALPELTPAEVVRRMPSAGPPVV